MNKSIDDLMLMMNEELKDLYGTIKGKGDDAFKRKAQIIVRLPMWILLSPLLLAGTVLVLPVVILYLLAWYWVDWTGDADTIPTSGLVYIFYELVWLVLLLGLYLHFSGIGAGL